MKRAIHFVLPLLIFVVSTTINYYTATLNFKGIVFNIIFVFINVLGLMLYFSLKTKKFKNPIDTYIGLGDIAFFIAITPLFNLKPYILFFIIGLIFSMVAHLISRNRIKTIPLAGYLSVFLILCIVIKNLFNVDFLF